ncbi:hypothetical protein C173_22962 [Paenibacillus sp. FSL R7-277]|uniref:AraC family transcriptional regulator n=1 Tax=Paenibacillus sp. FSL R7-277 TaxID=1227352 RepID=UPI0003E27DC3|nr:AraC family transcriptional regulator [Paenibacillus sp. FSL R7-277]ETT63206.1 hypothetical protein C173_22962 [Paenibacillus sp. FSL R7-277]
MNIEGYIELWDNQAVRLLDIRQSGMEPGREYREQRLSSHTFILVQGRGQLWLDETPHALDGWYVLHGSKGAVVRMKADTGIELYSIMYMLVETEGEVQEPLNEQLPGITLQCEYGLKPHYPLPLLELASRLYEKWGNIAFLERIQVTAIFYQWLYELLQQMHHQQQEISLFGPDRTRLAVRYMQDHYGTPLTVAHVAAVTHCSPRLLTRLFKSKLQTSPGQVLARIRLNRAYELLHTEATLQEIGERVGYANAYAFSRFFKKHEGVSPDYYRRQISDCEREGIQDRITLQPRTIQMAHETLIEQTRGRTSPMAGIGHKRRNIQTVMGEITIPDKPERVVIDWSLGEVLALGLTPVGAPHTLLDSNRLLGQYIGSEVQDIGNHNQVSIEKVLELEPDLIITWDKTAFASFARIAPTVVFQSDHFRSAGEGIAAMGHILNRTQEAAKWIIEYETRAAYVRNAILRQCPERRTFTVIDPNWSQEIRVIGNAATRGGRAAYEVLGLQPPWKVWQELFEQGHESIWIDQQDIAQYTEDYLLVLRSKQSGREGHMPDMTELHRAAGCGIIELQWENYFLSDPLSALLQAEEMTKLIAQADQG